MFHLVPVRGERDALLPTFQGARRDFDRIFSDLFGEDGTFTTSGWPACELLETKEDLVLRVEVPGLDPKDVEIRVEGDVLTVGGEMKREDARDGEEFRLSERKYGAWRRAFRLPAYANPEKVEAQVRNGVLTLTIAKREEAKSKIVRVKVS